ncbi:hypothetical protein, partial [Stenotrophomonas geniculata]|uniref:hypothetical protein n=2 Tax=Stenotrophomonas geniculata TaxID=86188 RepID=UPI0038B4262C
IRFPQENGSDPGSDLAFVFCFSFFNPGWTRTEIFRGREGGLRRGVSRMDAATEPYLMEIWQRRCREPAWAAVRAWISTIAM